MTVINTNVKALYTQQALKTSTRDSQIAMQQLSTGKRINSSKDDAAGLAIAARMTQNIQGLKQAVRNAGDAISLIQTAEGATNEISTMLQRMSELAVQSANSTYSAEQRGYLDQEFQQLKQEIIRISETHEWNGFPILNGKAGEPVGIPTTTTVTRASIASDGTPKTLEANDLVLKVGADYFPIPASDSANDTKSNTYATSSNATGSAIAIAAAINSQLKDTGVSATAIGPVISASKTNVDKTSSVQTDLFVNGTKISLSLSSSHTHAQRRQYVMDSINYSTADHGVQASDSGSGGLTLTTVDGRNLSVWYDDTLKGYDFGLGLDKALDPDVEGVSAVANANLADTSSVAASTVYGSVTLKSNQAFSVGAGTAGLDNFEALGFRGSPVKALNVGRLSFQIGPSADQLISIDLSDFGKNGDITNLITGDDFPTDLKSVNSANNVMDAVNSSLDRVAQTRATMGAVMNRLQHVIDNVTNVVTASEASRSQIEDADYATASTELARTQIMQQAATAVLAQANTDQQTVLKLLQ